MALTGTKVERRPASDFDRQKDQDIVDRLALITECMLDLRHAPMKADAEKAAGDIKTLVDEILQLREYPPILVEQAQ